MEISLGLLGLIFNFAGSLVLMMLSFLGVWHQKDHSKKWHQKYWWMGWKPILRIRPPNEKPYWKIRWNYLVVRNGAIPPQHQWNIIGFFYMLIGFYLQLLNYIR